jgi:hypothetical protein
MTFAVCGIKSGNRADQMTVEAEDALIAALKVKTAHPEAAITYRPHGWPRRRWRKGAGQGQCGPEQHAPDPELGKRIPGDGPHTLRRKAG